jgi:hypothetical protein
MPSVLLDNERPTDPGAHHVVATGDGLSTATADVSLSDGQSQRISMRLESAASASPAPAGPSAAPLSQVPLSQPPPPSSAPSSPNHTAAFVTFGIGAAGLVFGSVFGVLALGDKSRLDSVNGCPGACPASSQSDVDAIHRDALLSTIGIGVGVVGAAVGTILFVSAHSDESPRAAGIELRPWVGLGSAGVGGTFQ